jgi:hypothetical protein
VLVKGAALLAAVVGLQHHPPQVLLAFLHHLQVLVFQVAQTSAIMAAAVVVQQR